MAPRLVLVVIVGCTLLSLACGSRPIGYLHSWNQITTLTHIVAITQDFAAWSSPYDTVTRLPPSSTPIVVAAPFSDFCIFEEFPLYHILSALIARLGISSEDAARIVSVIFWALGAFGIHALARQNNPTSHDARVAWIAILLYCFSFPIAYYGVAIMSDTAMVALWTWSLVFLGRSQLLQHTPAVLAGLGYAALSGLFKSYGLLSLAPWVLTAVGAVLRPPDGPSRITTSRLLMIALAVALAATPTLCWHLFAILHSAHQEFESHSVSQKLSMIGSGDFWNALQKGYFRYLSYLPGVVVIIAGSLWFRTKRYRELPSVTWASVVAGMVFILATADKIPHHDYYLLMPAIPILIIAAHIIAFAVDALPVRSRASGLAIIFLAMAIPSCVNMRKALLENPDVLACADLVTTHTRGEDLVGVYSDSSRYNSIIFYAKRFGLRVEGSEVPLRDYRRVGAHYLVTNLNPTESARFEKWLTGQKASIRSQIQASDYKGQPRVCKLYDLESTSKVASLQG
jgi:hypothetical protein